MSVGAALRRRRNELGMTLRELAEEAELTSGFLSQVENDHVSPSLNSLGRIAEVLRIPLFQLLSTHAGNPVVRADERTAVPWMDTGVEVRAADAVSGLADAALSPHDGAGREGPGGPTRAGSRRSGTTCSRGPSR